MKKSSKNKLQNFLKQGICGLLAFMMLITAFPLQVLAGELDYDKTSITSKQNLNKEPVTIKKAGGKTAEEIVKNPDMPKLYTMRADYKLPRNDEEIVGYQPYIATVGDDEYTYTDLDGNERQKVLTEAEKFKINKTINLPDIDGYTSPTKSFTVNYDYIKANAKKGNLDVNEYKGQHPYTYKAKQGTIKIKHTFQKLENRNEYGYRDGDTDFIYTYQDGLTGTSVTIDALKGEQIKGYVPEVNVLTTQVPQNSNDFEIEMRYNRAIFDVKFDSKGGTELPGMTLIYGQTIPKLNFDIEKPGSILQGWKVNKDITYTDQAGNKQTLTKDTLIKKEDFEKGGKFQDGIKYAMPAENLTFTAEWEDEPKADYVIQFWTEKPDYNDKDDKLPLRDRYDFIGARRIDNVDTGSRPDLTNLDIHGITFPDLNDGRLEKAQDDKEEFERYYFFNEDLTKKQNASKEDPNVQKTVSSTGETVYNVYYDRRVYTLYFTTNNEEGWDDSTSYWPTITRSGQVIGKEGSPYKVEARFNQSLDKIWPRDEEISGLPPASSDPGGDMGPIGWTINVNEPGELIFRDTPPYRLSAEDFIDSQDVLGTGDFEGNGHGDQIPIGENQTKARGKYEISLAASSWDQSVVHHIDIIKDDFEGNEQIDYDLSYWKSDTNGSYAFILPNLQGFTLKQDTRDAEWVLEKPTTPKYRTINDVNTSRNEITPFRSDADKIEYIAKFPWGTKFFDGKNRYNFANYSRNKYKLKLNNDPKIVKNDNEYGAGNILDVPYEKPLKDLKLDTGHVPTRPAWVPEDWSFLGWALDPAGENLVKDGNETKLHYDQVLYAKWGEPETIWKVKFDPNGGSLRDLSTENISDESKKLEVDGVSHTYPEKVDGENTFNFVHKMILKEPKDATNNIIEPTRPGYNFAGWEFVRYKKDKEGNDTEVVDTSYKDLYKVPEMYHFGNEVVGNVHLRAIWNKSDLITVEAIHHFLNAGYNETSKEVQNLYDRRVGSYTTGLGSRQGDKYLLVPQAEWEALYNANTDYKTYKDETNRDNSYNQILRVEPEKIPDPETGDLVDNPKAKNNRFEFFYKPFKERVYDVNYLDDRGKEEVEAFMEKAKAAYQKIKDNNTMTPEAKGQAYKDLLAKNKEEFASIKEKHTVVPSETVVNGKRHYDARNYRRISGWVLNDKPQQQLFFDIYEDTDTFAGINESGLDEINFFYKDVRVIEVKDPEDKVPDGYKRVTFIADKGGSFTDDKDNPVKELYYDVIVGLKSDNLPVPEEVKEGKEKVEGKYYITPDNGKKFIKWDNARLLNSNTIIDKNYTFTAYFDWSGVKVNELVRTESYKDPDGNWTNDFAPTLYELKAQVKWVNKDGTESDLPADATVTIVDESGNPLTQEDIFEKVKEMKKSDTEELVRTEIFKAKVTFRGNQADKEVDIPVKIYKNRYEALTSGGKPEFLSKAEKGELKDITGDYVKVTVNPTGKPGEKDSKIYYVNPKAWVEIPEIKLTAEEKEKLGFTRWTSDNDDVNTKGEYIFEKENIKQRYKFTKDTIIQPDFSKDLVEQDDPNKKPDVPDSFVKVVVKTSEDGIEKATEDTKFERTFWVNPTKKVTIPVAEPTGDTVKDDKGNVVTDAAGKEIKWKFREWSSPLTATFTEKETTITAKYEKIIPEPSVNADTVETYVGKQPEIGDYKKVLKASLGGEGIDFDEKVKEITVVDKPNVDQPGMSEAKVKVEFKNGQVKEVTVPVKVYDNIYPGDTNGGKTSETPKNYVKVTVNPKAYDEDDQKIKVYYVNPLAKVKIPEISIKEADKEEYGFKKWITDNEEINSSNNDGIYDFAKDYQFTADTEIYAFYEKNGEPEINIDFETKEIVKNIGDKVSVKEYKDALIIPKDDRGNPLVDVKAINVVEDPDTSKEGYSPAKIQVVYDDGKTEEVIVIVKVLPDYVEQTDPNKKPDVPDNFVKVIVETTDKATEDIKRTFWVNPSKKVRIPVDNPIGKEVTKADGTKDFIWLFTGWDEDLTQQFTKETTITAQYKKDFGDVPEVKPIPEAKGGFIYTDLGKKITEDQYKKEITLPDGYSFEAGTKLEMDETTAPNINKSGRYNVVFAVTYPDGSSQKVEVLVFVGEARPEPNPEKPDPKPGYPDYPERPDYPDYPDRPYIPMYPEVRYETIIQEKIVKVPVPISDSYFKEVRYMQGFKGYFRPNDGLTRAEAAQILANALVEDGYKYNPNFKISYKDVGDAWYTRAVKIVTEARVFEGYDDGNFKPQGKITRNEWIATLKRFQELGDASGNDMKLRDNHWAKAEIQAAFNEGWLKIYTDGLATYKGDEFIPRQEVAAVSNKAFNRIVDKTYIGKNNLSLVTYKDVNPSMWAYEDILCASNTFLDKKDLYRAHWVKEDKNQFNIDTSDFVIVQKNFQRNPR